MVGAVAGMSGAMPVQIVQNTQKIVDVHQLTEDQREEIVKDCAVPIVKEKVSEEVSQNAGIRKIDPVNVTVTVQSPIDVLRAERNELREENAIILAHKRFLKGTAKLAYKLNLDNGFMYDEHGGKHLFDMRGMKIDEKG